MAKQHKEKKDHNYAVEALAILNQQINLQRLLVKKAVIFLAIGSAALIIGVGACINSLYFTPVKRQFIAVTKDWKIMRVIPMTKPFYSNHVVGQFAIKALDQAFNFSYINRKSHFRTLINYYFTSESLSNLLRNWHQNGMMERIERDKLFVSFAAISAPFVVKKGLIVNPLSGTTAYWVIQFRGVLSFTNGAEMSNKTNDYAVTLQRVNSLSQGQSIRVTNIVSKNVTTNGSGG